MGMFVFNQKNLSRTKHNCPNIHPVFLHRYTYFYLKSLKQKGLKSISKKTKVFLLPIYGILFFLANALKNTGCQFKICFPRK